MEPAVAPGHGPGWEAEAGLRAAGRGDAGVGPDLAGRGVFPSGLVPQLLGTGGEIPHRAAVARGPHHRSGRLGPVALPAGKRLEYLAPGFGVRDAHREPGHGPLRLLGPGGAELGRL